MDPEKLKVVDLRKELQNRGLNTKGNKAELVKRLKDALDGEAGSEKGVLKSEQDPAPEEKEEEEDEEEASKEPVKTSPKKPAPVKKEPPPTPKKVAQPIKESTATAEPVVEESEENGDVDNQYFPLPKEEPSGEPEKMEVETRGEKRKRDDDDEEEEDDTVEVKKKKEDVPEEETKEETSTEAQLEDTKKTKSPAKKQTPKQNEPEIDFSKPLLSWFDSDLHLKIDDKTFLSAKPHNEGCFGYVWSGARATHGVSSGKICFEVKITEELKWEDMAEKMQEKTDKTLKEGGNKYKIDRRQKDEKKDEEKPAESETEKENTEKKVDEKAEQEKNKDAVEAEKSEEAQVEEKQAEEKKDEEEQKMETEAEEKPKEDDKPHLPSIPTHYFRVGFSLLGTSLQLGETQFSYGYESTGKFVTNKQFQDYGVTFGAGDVVGAYLNIDNDNVSITFTVNGALQPTAITVPRTEFPEEFSLFPHVLCRNYAYELNFGQKEEPWFPHPEELKDYQFLQEVENKVEGPRRPEKREDCEVLLMIGLPSSGKTHWVKNHIENTPDKSYTIIGNYPLFDRMTVEGEPIKSRFNGCWKLLVDRMQKFLNYQTDQASLRRRNYIIDQTNVFSNAQRRKLRGFDGFKRKAVVLVCEDEEQARRLKEQQQDYGKFVPDSTLYDLKAQMELPQKCEWLDEIIFPELNEEESRKKVKEYNEDANKKGYFKRWTPSVRNNRGGRFPRGSRGGRGGSGFGGRFDRYPAGPAWGRPGPWGRPGGPPAMRGAPRGAPIRGGMRGTSQQVWQPRDQSSRGGQQSRGAQQSRGSSANQRGGSRGTQGYGNSRQNPWQNSNNSGGGYNSWGSGNSRGSGWNASMYGSQGYGAWNTNSQQNRNQSWNYGSQSYGQTQKRSYGSQGYGNQGYNSQSYSNQGYGTQGGYGSQGYGNSQTSGYGQSGYGQGSYGNYYGQYGQQQGWGGQKRK
ncbi:heterogeneous nuclear ribonucleoprotein U-like protein 1 isoform X2 [Anthonomus grandis grandis]|uniref:heterogeneous nuclear ribonucleoprotein U-like protein 1 isoform X2 n=1 Tax=Anthonomus grandis grandis TaxID=2921223 RepID=UPI002165EE49|nr:heterogeneous nuclear ribonucleoprotein U-like protein 1 isoform X2 [Anthonomus grandis grandis]